MGASRGFSLHSSLEVVEKGLRRGLQFVSLWVSAVSHRPGNLPNLSESSQKGGSVGFKGPRRSHLAV